MLLTYYIIFIKHLDRYASIYYINNLWLLTLQMLVESSREQAFL